MMSQSKTSVLSRVVKVVLVVIVILIVGVMVLTIIGGWKHLPSESEANVKQILAELPDARIRWNKQSITDYDIDGTASVALACIALPEAAPSTFHVRDGKVQVEDFSYCEEFMAGFLPPAGFTELEDLLERLDTDIYFLDIKFDAVYGYISEYSIDCHSTNVSDCFAHFMFFNLRRVNR